MSRTSLTNFPNTLSPINNLYGNYWQLYNPSFGSFSNFNYIVNLFGYDPTTATGALTYSSLGIYKIPSRPVSGVGIFSGYKSLLSLLSYDLQPFITAPTLAEKSEVEYTIEYGQEWNPNIAFTGPSCSILRAVIGTTSYFGFSFSSPQSFLVGDILTITSNNPYLAGTSSIILVTGSNTEIVTNLTFTTQSSVSYGVISDMLRWENYDSNVYYGYNGTRQYNEQNIDFTTQIVMGQSAPSTPEDVEFITDYPNIENKLILSSQNETLSTFIDVNNFGVTGTFSSYGFAVLYNFYDNNNNLISYTYSYTNLSTASASIQRWDIPVGTAQINLPSNTSTYNVTLYSAQNTYSPPTGFSIIILTTSGFGGIATSEIAAGGTGYIVGMTFSVNGGAASATGIITSVSPFNGVVTGYTITYAGTGYTAATGHNTTTASPSGFITLVTSSSFGRITGITVSSGGSGYNVGEFFYIGSGGAYGLINGVNASGSVTSFVLSYSPSLGYSAGHTYSTSLFATLPYPYVQKSETLTYGLDTDCQVYNNVRLMFLNSYGAFDFFNFRLDDKMTYNVTRNEYKQELTIPYTTGARQRTILSQKVQEQHTINTNWVDQNVYSFLSDLVTSPEVYVINENTGDILPIIVVDTSYEFKTAYREQLFNLTLTYEYSYGLDVQNQ
jgi:hypothetical protein